MIELNENRLLTDKEKLEIYIDLRKYLENSPTGFKCGYCYAIHMISKNKYSTAKYINNILPFRTSSYKRSIDVYYHEVFELFFPELYKHKPNNDKEYWFNSHDKQTRIDILDKVINELKTKMNHDKFNKG